jgi:hypothetical protein
MVLSRWPSCALRHKQTQKKGTKKKKKKNKKMLTEAAVTRVQAEAYLLRVCKGQAYN